MKRIFSKISGSIQVRRQFNAGVNYLRSQRYPESLNVFTDIVRNHPDYHEAWYHLGLIQERLQRPDLAAECLKTAIKLNHAHVPSLYLTGKIAFDQKKITEAVFYLQQAVRYAPARADAINLLGLCRREEGNVLEAINCFRNGLNKDPGNTSLLFNLGTTLIQINDHEKAIDCFTRLIEIRPDYTEAYINLASIHRSRKDKQAEIRIWKLLQARYPDDTAVLEMLKELGTE